MLINEWNIGQVFLFRLKSRENCFIDSLYCSKVCENTHQKLVFDRLCKVKNLVDDRSDWLDNSRLDNSKHIKTISE